MILSRSQRQLLETVKSEIHSRRKGRRHPGRIPNQVKIDILSLVGEGIDLAWIAGETGIKVHSIKSWREQQGSDTNTIVDTPSPQVFAVEPTYPIPPFSASIRLQVGSVVFTIERARSS